MDRYFKVPFMGHHRNYYANREKWNVPEMPSYKPCKFHCLEVFAWQTHINGDKQIFCRTVYISGCWKFPFQMNLPFNNKTQGGSRAEMSVSTFKDPSDTETKRETETGRESSLWNAMYLFHSLPISSVQSPVSPGSSVESKMTGRLGRKTICLLCFPSTLVPRASTGLLYLWYECAMDLPEINLIILGINLHSIKIIESVF